MIGTNIMAELLRTSFSGTILADSRSIGRSLRYVLSTVQVDPMKSSPTSAAVMKKVNICFSCAAQLTSSPSRCSLNSTNCFGPPIQEIVPGGRQMGATVVTEWIRGYQSSPAPPQTPPPGSYRIGFTVMMRVKFLAP
uniref:Uncharacterized protein n=1 Tax=Cacopsylla melanoneura TaxID=428564 RepID=A0A8D8VEB4_9HEMI